MRSLLRCAGLCFGYTADESSAGQWRGGFVDRTPELELHVNDIRLRAHYSADFEILCARCVDPVAVPLAGILT